MRACLRRSRATAGPRKNSPGMPENTNFGPFFVRRASFFAFTRTSGRAGRTFSRSGPPPMGTLKPKTPLRPLVQASMKPPSPMLAPKQRPLKPATPLQPKNAPKTPISHPQRRWRFHSDTDTGAQRRRRFQTTGPPGRQGQAAVPTGSNDTTAIQISHVIYRGHFSRHLKNVAIPTIQIQCLKKPQGNYVRK